MSTAEPIGIIGGSGFYRLLDDPAPRPVTTPYGDPSEPPAAGTLAGRPVVFLPRHGADHRFAPQLVPYRANTWALRSLGVRQVLSLSAVGSLDPAQGIGSLAVPDQILDRTAAREHTYFADGRGAGHITFADPYCPRGRTAAIGTSGDVRDGGTLVVINGPRFSTRAESRGYAAGGGTLIGMTAMPEASLAREIGLCYTTLALVTDLDAGVDAGEGVTHAEVLARFAANLPRMRDLLVATLGRLPAAQGDCGCGDTAHVPASFRLP
jgi:5'-methylthioadenosine phosphorylase